MTTRERQRQAPAAGAPSHWDTPNNPFDRFGTYQLPAELPADPNEARAVELRAVGMHSQADAVGWCGTDPARRCNRRSCPVCAAILAEQWAQQIAERLAEMAEPTFTLLTIRSLGRDDLRETITVFRRGLLNLRRLTRFAAVVQRGTGVIEPKLAESRSCWAVHVHLIVDGAGLDYEWANAQWRRYAGNRPASFGPSLCPVVNRAFLLSLARYVAKPKDWCPAPGKLTPREFGTLQRGIRGRQLVVAFGYRKKAAEDE